MGLSNNELNSRRLNLPFTAYPPIHPFTLSARCWSRRTSPFVYFMIKRMASKINAHVHGLHKPLAEPSPASTHSHITDAALYDHRGSISTDRTSDSMEVTDELLQTKRKRTPQRPKGTYRLNDFLIHRTLGTGSFGRVHLGQCSMIFSSDYSLILSVATHSSQ